MEICHWHANGRSARWIGEALGRHHGTISRELARNSKPTKQWNGGYEPVRAHQLALRRRRWDRRFKLARQPVLRRHVRDKLAMGWSPEAIAGRLALERSSMRISHEAIYRYAYFRSAQKDYWHRFLPQKKHRRGWLKRGGKSPVLSIKERVPLSQREAPANARLEPGHWEADILAFSRYGQNILVATERLSRFFFAAKPACRQAPVVKARLNAWLKALPKAMRRSVAFDNGTEFADHHKLAKALALKTCFCDPHSPWQKGGVENLNGRLRRNLPRNTDIASLSSAKLAAIVRSHNKTPRKCLGFKTPTEVFHELTQSVALQP